MQISLERVLSWLTAFFVVFSLYAHTFLNVDSAAVSPLTAAAIAVGLCLLSGLWFLRMQLAMAATGYGVMAAFLLIAALGLAMISGVWGGMDRGLSLNDLGLLLLIVGLPVLMYCNSDRLGLLTAIGWWCAVFALLDAFANGGAAFGLWTLQDAGARYTESGARIERFGGLTGNTHGGGVVALIAVAFLARDGLRPRRWWAWGLTIGPLLAIGASLLVIDARRYLGEAMFVAALLCLPIARTLPMQIVSVVTSAAGLFFTWQSHADEENLRVSLMVAGWRDAASHILVGNGVIYRSPVGSDFNALWSARVTESGVLDTAIQFGWTATILFVLGALIALRGTRQVLTWPVALLAVMIGELAYGNPLDGFIGAVTFYAALVWVICDEARSATAANAIDNSRYPHRATLANAEIGLE